MIIFTRIIPALRCKTDTLVAVAVTVLSGGALVAVTVSVLSGGTGFYP
jgi:hypothetical protein